MKRTLLASAAAAAMVAASVLAAAPAAAVTNGNATTQCQSVGLDEGVKLDTGKKGTFTNGVKGPWEGLPLGVTVTIESNHTFSWESDESIATVLVKAGPRHFVFDGGFSGEGDLKADYGVKFGISHITFCEGGDIPQ